MHTWIYRGSCHVDIFRLLCDGKITTKQITDDLKHEGLNWKKNIRIHIGKKTNEDN